MEKRVEVLPCYFFATDMQVDEPHSYSHWYEYTSGKVIVLKDIIRQYPNIVIIGEIGVRSGYGAVTMMRVTGALTYYGWDNWCSIVGESGKKHAEELLKPYNHVLYTADTQKLDKLPGVTDAYFDLIHIDGCHKPECVYHDMSLAYDALHDEGMMLLDDYNYPHVQEGVHKWLLEHEDCVVQTMAYPSTMRGDLAIRIKK